MTRARGRFALRTWAAGLGLGVLLTGCATLAPVTGELPTADADQAARARWTAHVARVLALDPLVMSARVAVQDAEQGGTFKVRWQERAGRLTLAIQPPIGGGRYLLREYPGGVELTTSEGQVVSSQSADALMSEYLSLTLPVEGARYWVRGLPDPRQPATQIERTEEGLLADFAQGRWRVSILGYADVDGTPLPQRLFLSRDEVKVRIAVSQWETSL